MYSVAGYGAMIADRVRTDSYCEALRQAVRPGAIVLDIGTGAGIFAMLACRFGARKVYAVEPDDVIQLARELAAANGFQDRIEFIQNQSTEIGLPERADVIVSDLRGVLPLCGHHLTSIVDARERFLAPNGILIPQADALWAAVVESRELHEMYADPWEGRRYQLDLTAGRSIATNSWRKSRVTAGQLLTEPKSWATIDYRSVSEPNVLGNLTWTINRSGTAHGLTVWFDALLAADVCYSNSPMSPELIYGNAFFPLAEAVSVETGDTLSLSLAANLIGEDYLWRWKTSVLRQGDPSQLKARFDQSTLFGAPLSLDRLHKKAATYCPNPTPDGELDYFILGLIDGQTPLKELARRVRERFPHRFTTEQRTLSYVGDLSQRYS